VFVYHYQEFALGFALAQRAAGPAAVQHRARIYKEKFAVW